MNDALNQSNRRQAEIRRLTESLKIENVTRCFFNRYKGNTSPVLIKAINDCIDTLCLFLNNKVLDFAGMLWLFEPHQALLTEGDYLTLLTLTEEVIQEFLRVEQLRSKERIYEIETAYIASQGYELDQRYIISFPENPNKPDEEWFVTEFGIYGNNTIRPRNGCKIKKNGEPYAQACYISLPHDENIIITKVLNP